MSTFILYLHSLVIMINACSAPKTAPPDFPGAQIHGLCRDQSKLIMTFSTGSGRLSAISMASLNCSMG